MWEHFPHDADIGIRGFGKTLAEAFEQAAVGLTAVITDPQTVRPLESVEIACEAPSKDLLFVDWLNALIYEMAVRGMLFSEYSVTLEGTKLLGRARGESVDVTRHHPAVEVKGATYTELDVSYDSDTGIWVAQCVVDV